MSDKYLWILGGGLMQVPAIEEAHKLGLKTIVSDANKACVCANKSDLFCHLDIFDIEDHLRALRNPKWAKRNFDSFNVIEPDIQGVLCAGIDCPETAAAMQEHLGKPTAPREVARICHNKTEFRKAMKFLEWPVPEELHLPSDLDEDLRYLGPFIIKNTLVSGSRGSRIFRNRYWESPKRHEVEIAIQKCKSANEKGEVIIEELWLGTEHTVETLFDVNGKFWPCFITDRFFDYSKGFALETGLRHPSTLPSYIQRKAYAIAEELGRDLGVKYGPFKLDIIVTEEGIRVIEATTRFSGGFDCMHLVPAATGKNVLRAGTLTAMGRNIDNQQLLKFDEIGIQGIYTNPLFNSCNKVALSESLWPSVGKIVDIQGVKETKKIQGVEHVIFRKNVGDFVEEYVDCTKRVCWIITSGNTEDEAREAMNKAKDTIRIIVE